MEIDHSAAERFLSYADGDVPISDVWGHPAYGIARKHANLLDLELSREDVIRAMAGEQTTFAHVGTLEANRERIHRLLDHVRSKEVDWTEQMKRHLERVTPDEDVSDIPLFLAIGYELGIGLQAGAYVNLNEPLFLEQPRQLLYVGIHESSHVLYDRVHGFSDELESASLDSLQGQRTFFNTLFHTEAFATYTPLKLREANGNAWDFDHTICEDYRVVADETQLQRLVEEYDAFRETLREETVPRETLWTYTFSELRLPYRVGCAMVDKIEEKRGLDEVRNAFYLSPDDFLEEYDWVLDEYRTSA